MDVIIRFAAEGATRRINYLINNKLSRLLSCFRRPQQAEGEPLLIARPDHCISRKAISPAALKVLYRLKNAGHAAYLVGGGVRDMLIGVKPKDFDVATDAHPDTVRQIFRNSRLIGRRFRLVHVYFPGEIIEVSTFRANAEESLKDQHLSDTKGKRPGAILSDNTYGTIEEDAWRRDFTLNALYYNIADYSVVDYTGGMLDLKNRLIRMIGDPVQRFHEDPVRLLRAIRFAAKLHFKLDAAVRQPLMQLSDLLRHVPPARLFDETLKLFFEGNAEVTYEQLLKTNYMGVLFPGTMDVLKQRKSARFGRLIDLAMQETDRRFTEKKSLNPGFLLAILLWPVVQYFLKQHCDKHHKPFSALYYGIDTAIENQLQVLVIPRRLLGMMRAVWVLQHHLQRRRPKRALYIVQHRYFRAAFDFLVLREKSGESLRDLVDWWGRFYDAKQGKRQSMIKSLIASKTKR